MPMHLVQAVTAFQIRDQQRNPDTLMTWLRHKK